ncbi:MAG TPA: hypothetical protein PLU52_07025, partial [Opitutaceae bacterium]|nr:hypothetical protein [Opitutaceae bacterium]
MNHQPSKTTLPGRQLMGRVSSALALLLLLAGCQTYEAQTEGLAQANKAGSLGSAVVQADQQAK